MRHLSRTWLFYATGILGLFLLNNALTTMLIYRYNPGSNSHNLPFLLSSASVGIAMFIGRLCGAIAQPAVGYFCDRLQSRWGRRRPFLMAALLPLLISFLLLFNPPFQNYHRSNIIYLTAILAIFCLGTSVYQVPYLAWLPYLAADVKQKVDLSGLMAIFSLIGTAVGGIAVPWLTQEYGFVQMTLVVACLGFVTLSMPLLIGENKSLKSLEHYPSFWQSLQYGWRNSTFKVYVVGICAAWIGVSILSASPAFIAVALLNKNLSFGGIINGIVLGSVLSGIALIIPLTRSWGKKRTFQLSMVWVSCGFLLLGIWSFWLETTIFPWLILLSFGNLGLASIFILPNAMLPDIIDCDQQQVGIQQEAVYFGIRGLLMETSIGVGSMIAGIILMLGKTPDKPLGVQLIFFITGIFTLISAWLFTFYKIKSGCVAKSLKDRINL